jgi:hypothetical protein
VSTAQIKKAGLSVKIAGIWYKIYTKQLTTNTYAMTAQVNIHTAKSAAGTNQARGYWQRIQKFVTVKIAPKIIWLNVNVAMIWLKA